jgi:hypothetical protein
MTQQLAELGFLEESKARGNTRSLLAACRLRVATQLLRVFLWRLARRGLATRQKVDTRRVVHSALRTSWLALKLLGLAGTIDLFRNATVDSVPPERPLEIGKLDDLVQVEAGRMLLTVACKERAAATFLLLRLQGWRDATLVIGLQRHPFRGHAWVKCAGRILTDDPEHCDFFVPVAELP